MLEKNLRSKIIKHLRQKWCGRWDIIHGGPYQAAGIADIVGCWKGRYVALEVKRPRDGQTRYAATARQLAYLDSVIAAGGIAAIVKSVEEVEAVMKGLR